LGALSGRAGGAARYEIKLDHKNLLKYARKWVSLPNTSFRMYTDQGIAGWLAGSKEMTAQEIQANLNKIQGALAQTIQYASPLVEVEQGLVSAIHQPSAGGVIYNFSTLPFGQGDDALAPLIANLQGSIQASTTVGNLKDACDPNRDVKEIFISSVTGAPYLPFVFKSLTEPIRNTWAAVRAAGSAKQYWEWRRARPLREFIPASARWTEAFLQGWVMGRITGAVQLEQRSDGVGGFIAKVWDESQQNWAYFPSELLGVSDLGVRKAASGSDESAWNVPAALLESLPLAMAHCQGMSLEPIRAYQVVTKIGATIKAKGATRAERSMADPTVVWDAPTGANMEVNNILDVWFTHGSSKTGLESQVDPLKVAASSEERREAALKWLSDVDARMKVLVRNPITKANFKDVNREFEIAPELIRVVDSVSRELKRTDLGAKAESTFTAAIPTQTDAGEVPPEVAG
jgi:hypothetical protein